MTNSKIRGVLVGGLALIVGLPAEARAQSPGESECANAAKVIAKGHPASTDDWAFLALNNCGASGARAFAQGVGRYAAETNIAALQKFMHAVDNWRDASIFDAVSQLATNTSASPQARVFAVRHLIRLLQPDHFFTYAGLAKGSDTTRTATGIAWNPGCAAQITAAGPGHLKGDPLPSDYEARIRTTLSSLAGSSSTPTPVRNAARCVLPPR